MTSVATKRASQVLETEPFRRKAIDRRLVAAVNKAVESAQVAYSFNPGSYTAQVLSDVVAIRTILGWLDDLGDK
jgi:hypothetical protein